MPVFLDSILRQQALTNNDLSEIMVGAKRTESVKTRQRTNYMKNLVAQHERPDITADDLLTGVATLYLKTEA